MRVTIEIPNHIACALRRITKRSKLGKYPNLSLAQIIANCVSYALFSEKQDPREREHLLAEAWNLLAMQRHRSTESHESR